MYVCVCVCTYTCNNFYTHYMCACAKLHTCTYIQTHVQCNSQWANSMHKHGKVELLTLYILAQKTRAKLELVCKICNREQDLQTLASGTWYVCERDIDLIYLKFTL